MLLYDITTDSYCMRVQKMLTGDILPTEGHARLAGYDIVSEQSHLRTLLGYCPQFEALLELLTVREHLELFSRIKVSLLLLSLTVL